MTRKELEQAYDQMKDENARLRIALIEIGEAMDRNYYADPNMNNACKVGTAAGIVARGLGLAKAETPAAGTARESKDQKITHLYYRGV